MKGKKIMDGVCFSADQTLNRPNFAEKGFFQPIFLLSKLPRSS